MRSEAASSFSSCFFSSGSRLISLASARNFFTQPFSSSYFFWMLSESSKRFAA